jgi:murein DD-endopeptidase MepM/ murein hydrolase activator NlpD
MNIIIVAKSSSTPKVLRLGNWRSLSLLGAAAGIGMLGLLGIGAWAGSAVGGAYGARTDLAKARAELEAQRAEVEATRAAVMRDMDALALRVGRLQAEAMRLNALGERLVKIGKLNDGEFDFRAAPAMGGPAPKPGFRRTNSADVAQSLDQLQADLTEQATGLGLLESMLMDRELDQSLLPAGMPVRNGYISSRFGGRTDPLTGKPDFHPGVDFNGTRGQDILAVASGVVAWSGRRSGYGNVVEIDHGNGHRTRYAHNLANLVQVGDPVRSGQLIARMGSTGRSTGNHVHFEVWKDGRLVNPSTYIRAMR